MDLLQLREQDGAEAWRLLAEGAQTSVAYLSQIAHGHRNASVKLARRLASLNTKLTVEEILRLHADGPRAAA